MQYRKKDYDSSSEIFMEGKLTSLDRDNFGYLVRNFIDSPQKNLIINFEKTKFLDTSGLGSLVIALQMVRNAQKNIVLKNPAKRVKESLDMVNFGSIFNIVSVNK